MSKHFFLTASSMLLAGLACASSALAQTTENQVPTPGFLSDRGIAFDGATGPVPSQWRAFSVGGGSATSEIIELPADELFPGSPPTRAVRFSISTFGANQGFDHFQTQISIDPLLTYSTRVYVRADNPDLSNQQLWVDLPVFESDGSFSGRFPGAHVITATNDWQEFIGPEFNEAAGTTMHLGFGPLDDGGDTAFIVAMPEILARPLSNQIPNPGFAGSDGQIVGDVNGTVPSQWRAFGVGGASSTIEIIPVAADELYLGSPATNAVKLSLTGLQAGADAGFDHEITRVPLRPIGANHYASAWIRTGNADDSDQTFGVVVPIWQDDTFVAQPGSLIDIANTQWSLFSTFSFRDPVANLVDMAFRLGVDGGEDSIIIALPQLLALEDRVFDSSFEAPISPM